jgi:hypothetical protein
VNGGNVSFGRATALSEASSAFSSIDTTSCVSIRYRMAAISPTNADARLRISRRCVRLCKLQFERDALFLSSRSRSEDVTGSLERRFCALIARRPWTNLTPKPRPRQWENPLHAYVRFGSKLARVGRGYTSISARCPSNSDRLGAWQRTDARCQSGLLQCNSSRDPDGPVSRDLLWRGGTGLF